MQYTLNFFLFFAIGLAMGMERDPLCPIDDLDLPLYLPHETNCSKFYQCSNGYKFELSCPGILQFDSNLSVCATSESANCGPNCQEICPETCPDKYEEDVSDLTKYFSCVNGQRVRLECPEGLYFSGKARFCDFPYNILFILPVK